MGFRGGFEQCNFVSLVQFDTFHKGIDVFWNYYTINYDSVNIYYDLSCPPNHNFFFFSFLCLYTSNLIDPRNKAPKKCSWAKTTKSNIKRHSSVTIETDKTNIQTTTSRELSKQQTKNTNEIPREIITMTRIFHAT